MKLVILTLALDAIPFLPRQLEVFKQLQVDWSWFICEGAADNTHDTKWCRSQEPRLSRDGTTEWINANQGDRVRAWRKQLWDGKLDMCNTPLASIEEPCVLVQIDSDEFWTVGQLVMIHHLLSTDYVRAYFACNFYVGPNIVVTPENDPINNVWLRAWRFTPGDAFAAHEPPCLNQQAKGPFLTKADTLKMGLVFQHYSYFYEHQVRYKETFYGYARAVEHWKRLQANKKWPTQLKRFFPWAKDGALATLVK